MSSGRWRKKEKYPKGGLLFTNKNVSMWTWTFYSSARMNAEQCLFPACVVIWWVFYLWCVEAINLLLLVADWISWGSAWFECLFWTSLSNLGHLEIISPFTVLNAPFMNFFLCVFNFKPQFCWGHCRFEIKASEQLKYFPNALYTYVPWFSDPEMHV